MRYLEPICNVLDKTLNLDQKDEYEYASSVLQNILHNLLHSRPLQKSAAVGRASEDGWDRELFKWAKTGDLETLQIEWFVPSKKEFEAAQMLIDKYMTPPFEKITNMLARKTDMEKEELLRNLRQIYKILYGTSEVLETIPDESEEETYKFETLHKKHRLTFMGQPIRKVMFEFLHKVSDYLLKTSPDDTDSLTAITTTFDVIVRSFGSDEEDIYDHVDEYKTIKRHRLNRLIRSKKHLESVLIERITIQYEMHLWLTNTLVMESTLPKSIALQDIFQLSISHYSEVRAYAQDLLQKIVSRGKHNMYKVIIPNLVELLKESKDVSHQMLKAALYIINAEKYCYLYDWEDVSMLAPALVRADHCDKTSIVELLKDLAIKMNKTYTDFVLLSIPIKTPKASETFLALFNEETTQMETDNENEVDANFLKFEAEMVEIIKNRVDEQLHWRHEAMAYSLLMFLLCPGHQPGPEVVEIWLQAMLHEQRSNRNMAFQALECLMKIYKTKQRK